MSRLLGGSVLLGFVAVMTGCVTSSVDDGLVYYSTFDNVEAIENPVVGPKGRVVGGSFVYGKKDGGFSVAALQPGALVDLPANFFGPQGTIEFWAKIDNPKDFFVDGGDPRFFQVDNGKDFPVFFLEYAANDGGGNSGLHVLAADNWQSSFPGFYGRMPFSRILGTACADWHHYMITWDRDCETKMAVSLDGVVQYTSSKFWTPEKMEEVLGGPQVLSFGMTQGKHSNLSKCDYVIDEFKIWNFAKMAAATAKKSSCEKGPVPDDEKAAPARKRVVVVLSDGSVLKGIIKSDEVRLETLIGPVSIQTDKIRSIGLEAQGEAR